MSFEFNQYYLKFLAYHHVSNRFRTFMMDNEFRRMEAGWLLDEAKLARSDVASLIDCDLFASCNRIMAGMSVWEYVDQYRKKSPVFYNFLFFPHVHETVAVIIIFFNIIIIIIIILIAVIMIIMIDSTRLDFDPTRPIYKHALHPYTLRHASTHT